MGTADQPYFEAFADQFRSVSTRNRYGATDMAIRYRATDAAGQDARVSCVDHDGARLVHIRCAGGVEMDGAVNGDAVVATFLWGEGLAVAGVLQPTPSLLVLGAGTQIRFKVPGDTQCIRIGVRGAALQRLRDGPDNQAFKRLSASGLHRPPLTAAQELRLQVTILRATALAKRAAHQGAAYHGAMKVAATEAALLLASDLGATAEGGPQRRMRANHRKLVCAALDLVDESPFEPVSVRSVCRTLAVTERTLERAFRDCLGKSLRSYERERRLRAVHGAILTEGDRRLITDMALAYGFSHLGRFSQAYAVLFGCTPIETRRRVWDRPAMEFAALRTEPGTEARPWHRPSSDEAATAATFPA
jgi:AraC-like DNA-binding protein